MLESTMGCDFCGVIVSAQPGTIASGSRVCGAVYGYNPSDPHNGAFAEYVVADSRLLLRVPHAWSDLQGAALGGIGWGTAGLALWDPKALALDGRPSKPAQTRRPVLVSGGATATGTMACQLLRLSGYDPIVTTSPASAPLGSKFGAVATVAYTSPDCAAQIQAIAKPMGGIKHVLDCVTDAESVAVCFASMSRVGGRYAGLEAFDARWRTRRSVVVETVMGFEMWGADVDLGDGETVYSRPANESKHRATMVWAGEVQKLLDAGQITHHPLREVEGRWEGIIHGLGILQRGEVRGQKLVVRLAEA